MHGKNSKDLCYCGHTRDWHHNRSGKCNSYDVGSYLYCRCEKFRKKPKPGRVRINPQSKKRAKENKTYGELKKQYAIDHPTCEVRGCPKNIAQIHHTKKPRSKYLNDTDTWLGTCLSCHSLIEDNKSWAREQGYLEDN